MLKINLDKIRRDLINKQATADSRLLPTPSTRREPSATEKNAEYKPNQWGILFCVHNKSYFEPCPQCHRDRKRAKMEYEAFLKRYSFDAK